MSDYTITDFDGRVIEIGTRVRLWDYDPHHPDWRKHDECYYGTVVDISEWDVDEDAEGRSVGVEPYVLVRFDGGFDSDFPTTEWQFDFNGGRDDEGYPYGCNEPVSAKVEELAVIGPPDVGSVKFRCPYTRNFNPAHTNAYAMDLASMYWSGIDWSAINFKITLTTEPGREG